jgi:hypothetical protein
MTDTAKQSERFRVQHIGSEYRRPWAVVSDAGERQSVHSTFDLAAKAMARYIAALKEAQS